MIVLMLTAKYLRPSEDWLDMQMLDIFVGKLITLCLIGTVKKCWMIVLH